MKAELTLENFADFLSFPNMCAAQFTAIYIGYFEATRGYVIYSPRAWSEVNESHIPKGPQNNLYMFHMDEVDLRDNCKGCFCSGNLSEWVSKALK